MVQLALEKKETKSWGKYVDKDNNNRNTDISNLLADVNKILVNF